MINILEYIFLNFKILGSKLLSVELCITLVIEEVVLSPIVIGVAVPLVLALPVPPVGGFEPNILVITLEYHDKDYK